MNERDGRVGEQAVQLLLGSQKLEEIITQRSIVVNRIPYTEAHSFELAEIPFGCERTSCGRDAGTGFIRIAVWYMGEASLGPRVSSD